MSLRKFPDDFKWAISSSAFQTEGAWNTDGKGPSIWDTFSHKDPCPIMDKSNADVTCESHSNYESDVKMVKGLGVKYYRFSFSWPRILPKGTSDLVNDKGVEFYRQLINLLLENGIEPIVTLFHFDLPQALQDRGGWMNKECVYWFADYAKFCFKTFGEKVKYWITINEPFLFTSFGYSEGMFAPAITGHKEWAVYLVFHHLLLAHANAFKIYDSQFRKEQKGQISIALDAQWFKPTDPNSIQDQEAALRCLQFEIGIFANPIFSIDGDYPAVVKEYIAKKSFEEGRSTSRLPTFTQEEIEMLKGSADFLAVNHFLTLQASQPSSGLQSPVITNPNFGPMKQDMDVSFTFDQKTYCYVNSHIRHEPSGLRNVLNFVRKEYNNPRIFITENGCPTAPGLLEDSDRIKFHNDYLSSVLDAIDDGCNVELYSAWTLMDNFEWALGYKLKFGFFHVDFKDPKRKRTPKASAKFYANVVANNGLDSLVDA